MTLITITHLSDEATNIDEQRKTLERQQQQRVSMNQQVSININTSASTDQSQSKKNLNSNLNLYPGLITTSSKQYNMMSSDLSEADQFSLNSCSPSPRSGLTSPFSSASTGYEGSQQSISGCAKSGVDSITNQVALLSSSMDNLTIDTSICSSSNSSGIHEPLAQKPLPFGIIREDSAENELSTSCESSGDREQLQRNLRKLSSNSSTSSSSSSSSGSSTSSSAAEVQPVRRKLSRIEQRQSLSDLGYGKIESYAKLQRLGKGTYATVYMGRSRLSNEMVALKEILKEHDEGAPCTAIREVSLLRLLRHNNIVTLHDICHTPKKLTLVFEYVGPDLYAYMRENNNLLSMHNIRLLRGISFCHSRQVLHRDLKPQNLLINSRGELKICDFGLARAKSIPTKSYSNEVVTLWYRPPDVLLGNIDYNDSIDMWGIGCIFYEMVSGRTFFPGSSVRQQLYLIFSCLGAPNKHNWPEILQNQEYQSHEFPSFRQEKLQHLLPRLDSDGMALLMKFLRFRPSERITAEQAKLDPFFSTLPEKVFHLNELESIFDVPGVYLAHNPGKNLSNTSSANNHRRRM